MIYGTDEFQEKINAVKKSHRKIKASRVNRIFMPLLFLVQLLTISKANGQIVRFINNAYKEEYYVFETTDSSIADYYVYRPTNPTEAIKEGVWFITDDPFIFRDKAILLHRVKSAANADMVVFYVRNPKYAGKARKKPAK
jgi:hypothetical protein